MRKTNINAVVEALGISRRRIYALIEEGVLPKPIDGHYDFKECAIYYLVYRIKTDKEAQLEWERWQMAKDVSGRLPRGLGSAGTIEVFPDPPNTQRRSLRLVMC